MRHWSAKPLIGIAVLPAAASSPRRAGSGPGRSGSGSGRCPAGDHLGDRVLDLDARIHLDEEPLAGSMSVEELDRAGVVVVDRPADPDRGLAQIAGDALRSGRRPAPPRSLSDGGAVRSSRARAGGRRCRAGRRGSGLRYASRAGCSAPGRRRRCRMPRRLRAVPRRAAPRSAGFSTTRMPRPPPPNAALMISGKPIVLAIFSIFAST